MKNETIKNATESEGDWMRTIGALMPEVRKLLEKAFNAGREDMRRELSQVLGHRLLKGRVHNMNRAPNGTVRPAVISIIGKSHGGISASNVTKTTGFKDNSVRATLSTLRKEGLVEQRGTLWFSVQQEVTG